MDRGKADGPCQHFQRRITEPNGGTVPPFGQNKANYDLILSEKNLLAFQLFADWCEYGGFERSVTSIEIAKDYMAEADPAWAEEKLQDLVSLFSGS
ncbi:MAG: hypothetical protein ILO68_07875 [Clostridia bacterium]|nr:hypothetical protein [Clostridia bacterium]